MIELPEFSHECFDKYLNAQLIIDLMASVLEQTNEKGPLLKNNILLFDDENNNESLRDAMIINNLEDSEDCKEKYTTHFGGSSQNESQLSTALLAITNALSYNEAVATSTY